MSKRLALVLVELEQMRDGDVLELQRHVSRHAQRIRMADAEYQSRVKLGRQAALGRSA